MASTLKKLAWIVGTVVAFNFAMKYAPEKLRVALRF